MWCRTSSNAKQRLSTFLDTFCLLTRGARSPCSHRLFHPFPTVFSCDRWSTGCWELGLLRPGRRESSFWRSVPSCRGSRQYHDGQPFAGSTWVHVRPFNSTREVARVCHASSSSTLAPGRQEGSARSPQSTLPSSGQSSVASDRLLPYAPPLSCSLPPGVYDRTPSASRVGKALVPGSPPALRVHPIFGFFQHVEFDAFSLAARTCRLVG
jgi:hypothetical protein